jgi:hypothetical protein
LRKAKPGRIQIEYEQLANGARIRYTANDPALINAIHQWFDAQLRDHARHAIASHPHAPRHPLRSAIRLELARARQAHRLGNRREASA